MTSSDTLLIRQARVGDEQAIYDLIRPYAEKKILLHRSLAEISANLDATLVCAVGEKICGTVSLVFFSPSLCEIRALVIAEGTQGRGIGKKLVYAAEDKALQLTTTRPLRIFALTYTPEFFLRCGYRLTAKENFPEKIYEVCSICLRRDDCREIAVEKILTK